MGTNYYWHKNRCDRCGREDVIHVGKDSFGWAFAFQGTETIRSRADWLREFSEPGFLADEYGDRIEVTDFLQLAERKRKGKSHAALYPSGNWHDPEGYDFCGGEFS